MRPGFLLALVLAGCQARGDETMDIVFDACAPLVLVTEGGGAEAVASVDRAIGMWNEVAGARLTREELSPETPRLLIRFLGMGLGQRGVYEDEIGRITVSDRLETDRARAVIVAHEVGHAFGLWHVDEGERRSVMNPENESVGPDERDAEAVWKLWGRCE